MNRIHPLLLFSSFALGLSGLISSGCATIDNLSTETYRKISLSSQSLQQESIGLLPMAGQAAVRDYLPMAEAIFSENLKRDRSDRLWIDAQESLKRIREAGLEGAFQNWTREYGVQYPPKQQPLEQFGKAVGARYLLLTELQRIELTEGATQVRLVGRIWDVENGEILWEGIGEGRGYVFLIFPWVPSSVEKTMAVASRGLIHRLP